LLSQFNKTIGKIMSISFKKPSKSLLFLTYGAGILTSAGIIAGSEALNSLLSGKNAQPFAVEPAVTPSDLLKPQMPPQIKFAKQDAASLSLLGERIDPQGKTAAIATTKPDALNPADRQVAIKAWKYFQENLNSETGLVNSVDKFAAVTLWDQSAALAGVISAREMGLISPAEFSARMSKMLATLAKLPLYKGELPNKVYNAKTLIPVSYGQLTQRTEIGWSAIDVGRLALWLKIVVYKYPQFKPQVEAVWKSWNVDRLTKDGQMYGTQQKGNKESYNQEGRLGYESYAAYGLKLWGLNVSQALDVENRSAFIKLYGQSIPFDIRDAANSKANNYVLSEPYILDGIETGFRSLPKAYADQILAAQEARYNATQQLTAITEDNLDRAPYFVYNTLYVNGKAWSTISDDGKDYSHLRFVSSKAAIGWDALYGKPYTHKLFNFVSKNLEAKGGWYSGFYETLQQPNAVLTANSNGIILESLLYKKVGQPLVNWARGGR
jgi:Protein of unknown function (DUF3131)